MALALPSAVVASADIVRPRAKVQHRLPDWISRASSSPHSGQILAFSSAAAAAFLIAPDAAIAAADAAGKAARDLSETPAAVAASALSPVLNCFKFLFLARIVMSWYPNLINVNKLPFVIAYAPTEPLLAPTRKIIPLLGGVDMAPVAWIALVSLMSELLLGPQGLLILLAQQQQQQP